jgi:RNA polymerase sigma factor (sigma-70 family)
MSSKYYIWKDPACAGVDIEWLEVSANEFFSLLKLPENKFRHFIRLSTDMDTDLDVIYIEATEVQFRDWQKDYNLSKYYSRLNRDIPVVSIDCPVQNPEDDPLYEIIPDEEVDVEKAALSHLAHEKLEKALRGLSAEDVTLLAEFYLREKNADEIAQERGVHRATIYRQIAGLLKRLQKFF